VATAAHAAPSSKNIGIESAVRLLMKQQQQQQLLLLLLLLLCVRDGASE
jgi:hypothetical protein